MSLSEDHSKNMRNDLPDQRSESKDGLYPLTEDQKIRLAQFLDEKIPEQPALGGMTTLASHHIDVGDNSPIKQRYYPVSKVVKAALFAEVDDMLAKGIIEPSNSEWSTPIVMVKRNGKYRFCLDFHRVNAIRKKDSYPLPFMSTILNRLRCVRYVTIWI